MVYYSTVGQFILGPNNLNETASRSQVHMANEAYSVW